MKASTKLGLWVLVVVVIVGVASWQTGWSPLETIVGVNYESAGSKRRLADAKDEPSTVVIELDYAHSPGGVFIIHWALNGKSHKDTAQGQKLWFTIIGVHPGDHVHAEIAGDAKTPVWEATIWHVRATGGVGDACAMSHVKSWCVMDYTVL